MIEMNLVEKQYRGNRNVLFVPELTIRPGEVTAILGANGSGKTTLLKTIMGLGEANVQYGYILVDGKPVQEQYEQLAFITEEGSFFPNMTAVQYGEFLNDFFPRFDRSRYERLLQFFELDPHIRIKRMSTGQKAKLEICAGFSKGAKYMLMDEPFNGKDMFTRRDFLTLMISSLKEDEAIILTTHIIDEIENVIDRAIILHQGRIKADVMIDELREAGQSLPELMAEKAGYKPGKLQL
ncbi:multidrug ABC transporter ATP-binding protein [Paenibacillus montaniterrae]|uniref:Multidrug ABC transporter ATP-binding protein n=1 Tax=Paenibacillus montaniterrae TaxID=429341 RepID=A0A919YLE3_9BACL|nr:ABC transporter ATP-binding protein [Paenibacillus montaniterrae]GIP16562.1 multidrug ABC transporter ATP-binding protein [Paenibacillus montaniterrae]